MDTKTNLRKQLVQFKVAVSKDFPVETMVFFGSRATGKSKKNSDVDLIIVSKKFSKLNFFQRGAKMYDYWDLDYPVDFLCYSPEEFEKKKKQISVVREAVETGIEI